MIPIHWWLVLLVTTTTTYALSSYPPQPQRVTNFAMVDYSAASEFIEKHYSIQNYFGPKPIKRVEPIWNAREGVILDNGQLIVPLGSMKGCGFCLVDAVSSVNNFEDLQQIQSIYSKEMRQIIPQALGRSQEEIESIFFWHPMIRREDPLMPPCNRSASRPATATVASMVHIDTDVGAYGVDGILNLVANNLVDPETYMDLDQLHQQIVLEKRRFVLLNIWRPLVPVQSRPLAIWATRYQEPKGMFPRHKPCLDTSQWYIFSDMQPSECLIFHQYDRNLDQPCDFWHTSLDTRIQHHHNNNHPPGVVVLPRQSFDMKAMVILKESVPPELDRLSASIRPRLTLEESGIFCAEQAKRRETI